MDKERTAKRRTGLFGGSFNPVHIGHLALANYLCEYGGLDEVWFLVSPRNPLKQETDLWDDALRLELVRIATADYPRFRASDVEFHLPRPSYTIHALRTLQAEYPNREFSLIIGADNWGLFPRWHQADEILSRHKVVIYPRHGCPLPPTTDLPTGVYVATEAPLMEISSTFIRRALREGRDVRYFLHPAVFARLKKIPPERLFPPVNHIISDNR